MVLHTGLDTELGGGDGFRRAQDLARPQHSITLNARATILNLIFCTPGFRYLRREDALSGPLMSAQDFACHRRLAVAAPTGKVQDYFVLFFISLYLDGFALFGRPSFPSFTRFLTLLGDDFSETAPAGEAHGISFLLGPSTGAAGILLPDTLTTPGGAPGRAVKAMGIAGDCRG